MLLGDEDDIYKDIIIITVKDPQWDLIPGRNTAQNSTAVEGPAGQKHASS